MQCISSLRRHARSLTTALLFLVCTHASHGADTYDGRNLTIPSLSIGSATYSNVMVTVDQIVSGPTGTAPVTSRDFYNPANNQLTVATVMYGTSTYYNVVITVKNLVSIGATAGVDTYDGVTLRIPSVQVLGGAAYSGASISAIGIISVSGGMPMVAYDSYNSATRRLTIPAVEFGGKVYTNVIITVGNVVSPGATLQSISVTPADPSAPGGAVTQFTAIGHYSDGTTQNITSSAMWSSGNAAVATAMAGGLATGGTVGNSLINASFGGRIGGTTLTVLTTTGAFDGVWVGTMTGPYTYSNWGCSGIGNTVSNDGGIEAIIKNGAIQYEVPVASNAIPSPGQTNTLSGLYISVSGNADWELIASYSAPSSLAPGMNIFSSVGTFSASGTASGTWTFTWSGAPCSDYVDGTGSGSWSMVRQ